MPVTSKQIRESIENIKQCVHPVVFYKCDDVGYPCGWVEEWTCLVCNLHDSRSTGGHGHCLGELGHSKFSKALVFVEGDTVMSKSKYYKTFKDFFKDLKKVPTEEITIFFRKRGGKIEKVIINQVTNQQEIEKVISRINDILEK